MDDMKLASTISDIARLAREVDTEFRDEQDALQGKQDAEESLLANVTALAVPALPAVSDAVPGTNLTGVLLFTGQDAVNGQPLRVYLLDDGTLFENWKAWHEELDLWFDNGTVRAVEDIVGRYPTLALVGAVREALTKQLGVRRQATAAARESASKINTVLKLLGLPARRRSPSAPGEAA